MVSTIVCVVVWTSRTYGQDCVTRAEFTSPFVGGFDEYAIQPDTGTAVLDFTTARYVESIDQSHGVRHGAEPTYADWSVVDSVVSAEISAQISPFGDGESISVPELGVVPLMRRGGTIVADLVELFGARSVADHLREKEGMFKVVNKTGGLIKQIILTVYIPAAYCHYVQIKEPEKDSLLIVDQQHSIRWSHLGVDSVIIQYADLGKGGGFDLVVDTVASASGEYSWLVPDTLARHSAVRLIDLHQSSARDTSETFKIKGYVLTRVDDDDEYEAFDVSKHGWSFENRESLLSPPVYNTTTQFNYSTGGSDPFTGDPYDEDLFATRPNNYAEPARFDDWPSVVRAFGTDDMYWGPLVIGRYNEAAVRRWLHEISDVEWGGSCSGMAVSALMAFAEKDRFGALYSQIGVVDELHSVVTAVMPDHVRETINELFANWSGEKQQGHIDVYYNDDPRTTLEELKEMLLDEAESHVKLGYLYINNRTDPVWAHAVTPFKLTRTSTTPNRWDLSIYNPNEPGRVEIIKIDSTANQWSYQPDYDGSGEFYVMDPIENYFADALYKAALDPSIPWPPASKRQTPGDKIKFYPSAWTHVEISGEAGSIGYADSAIFNTIDDAYFSVKPTGYASSPEWYSLPEAEYGITLSHFPNEESVLSTRRGNISLTYSRYDATAEQTDDLFYDGGMGAANRDAQSKRIFLGWIAEFEEQERLVEIENLVLNTGDSLYAEAEDDEAFRVEKFGSAGTYDLILTRGGPDTVVVFGSIGVPIGAGARHRIPPDWDNLDTEPVEIEIDADGDGTYEGSMQVRSNVSVEDLGIRTDELPTRFDLKQNYPNPFNPSTTIAYDVPEDSYVRLTVYDALGRMVATLVDEELAAGRHTVTWDGGETSSGVYFYKLEAGRVVLTRSMFLAK